MDRTNRPTRRRTVRKTDQVAAEPSAFSRCVRDGRGPEPSGEEGLADLHVLEAIQRATASRRLERVSPIEKRARPSKAQTTRRKPHGDPDVVHAAPSSR